MCVWPRGEALQWPLWSCTKPCHDTGLAAVCLGPFYTTESLDQWFPALRDLRRLRQKLELVRHLWAESRTGAALPWLFSHEPARKRVLLQLLAGWLALLGSSSCCATQSLCTTVQGGLLCPRWQCEGPRLQCILWRGGWLAPRQNEPKDLARTSWVAENRMSASKVLLGLVIRNGTKTRARVLPSPLSGFSTRLSLFVNYCSVTT